MKNLKKFLLALPLALVVICGGLFVGCKDKSPEEKFTANKQIKTSVDSVVSNLAKNVYNKVNGTWAGKNLTMEQVNQAVGGNHQYYVQVGTLEGYKSVDKVKVGDQSFAKDQLVRCSVGNNTFISDKAFYVKDNNLYIAAPIIAFETREDSEIEINGDDYDLDLDPASKTLTLTGVAFKNAADGTISQVEQKAEYNVAISGVSSWLKIEYQGVEATDVAITKKVKNKVLDSYGLTQMEDADTNPHVGFYPVKPADVANLQPFSYKYSIYIVGKGIINLKLNISKAED